VGPRCRSSDQKNGGWDLSLPRGIPALSPLTWRKCLALWGQ
jgi:hypothetical protein